MKPSNLATRNTPSTARTVKILSILIAVSLVLALLCSVWYSMSKDISATVKLDEVRLVQLEDPKEGDPAAIMHTTAGDMLFLLYPDECPLAVANFTQLAESGYYNDTYVFRVEQDVFFSGGSPKADGSLAEGGMDDPRENVERELTQNMWPFRGALCSLTTGSESGFWKLLTGTQKTFNGSRFLVVDSIEMTEEIVSGLQEGEKENPVADAFVEHGGIPNYSQQLTVFGQLYDGFEVLDAITGAALTGEENAMRPVEDIMITSVEIVSYSDALIQNKK
ncbi:MAG: peptidylprolyl isomerase [Oscillospiraceae bacterium]